MRFPRSPHLCLALAVCVQENICTAMPGLSSLHLEARLAPSAGMCLVSLGRDALKEHVPVWKRVSRFGDTNSMLSGKANLSSERFWRGVWFPALLWESL